MPNKRPSQTLNYAQHYHVTSFQQTPWTSKSLISIISGKYNSKQIWKETFITAYQYERNLSLLSNIINIEPLIKIMRVARHKWSYLHDAWAKIWPYGIIPQEGMLSGGTSMIHVWQFRENNPLIFLTQTVVQFKSKIAWYVDRTNHLTQMLLYPLKKT